MFGELLESRARRARNRAGTIASVVAHVIFIALAVAATRTPLSANRPVERVVALPVLPDPSPVIHRAPLPLLAAPRRHPATPQLPSPLETSIPVIALPGIPEIDLTVPPATAIGWTSDPRRPSDGAAAVTGGGGENGIPFAPSVEKPAIALSGNPSPRYPDLLRYAKVQGVVVVQVVIDTTGRVDMSTLRVVSSDHVLMTEAVIAALPKARFLPAETAGRKVRMWAVQSFVFEIR